MARFCINRFRSSGSDVYPEFDLSENEPRLFHRTIPAYSITPLVSLADLADELQVGRILVKDESQRFGLKAFKGLGASYAIYRLFAKLWYEKFGDKLTSELFWDEVPKGEFGPFRFCTATDGNHGRGVAWMARLINRKATVFMPQNSSTARIENIKNEGAEVVVVDGDYDLAVRTAAHQAGVNNWQVISDTSYEGYNDIPLWITCGYLTLFEEIRDQLEKLGVDRIDCCFIPGGVGALAATAAVHFRTIVGDESIKMVSVEPDSADCLLQSALDPEGAIRSSVGAQDSMMAGLNCATPSRIAWPIIRAGFDLFISVSDRYAKEAMRRLYDPVGEDSRVISGESGAASLAGLLALFSDHDLRPARETTALNRHSNLLIISTEGDTDPAGFQQIVKRTQS